jgi:transposase-like protein
VEARFIGAIARPRPAAPAGFARRPPIPCCFAMLRMRFDQMLEATNMSNTVTPGGDVSIERIQRLWAMSDHEAAKAFGVCPSTIRRWRRLGVPSRRVSSLADMEAATELLARRVKADRIGEVVRRPVRGLAGKSLLDLALGRRHSEVRKAIAGFTDLRRIQP